MVGDARAEDPGGLHPVRGKSNAGDHKGLVKIPRIFLAPPLLTSLAPTEAFYLYLIS